MEAERMMKTTMSMEVEVLVEGMEAQEAETELARTVADHLARTGRQEGRLEPMEPMAQIAQMAQMDRGKVQREASMTIPMTHTNTNLAATASWEETTLKQSSMGEASIQMTMRTKEWLQTPQRRSGDNSE
jgi:hypothetical protein